MRTINQARPPVMIGATDEFSSRRDEEGNDNFLGKKKKKKVKTKKRVE